MQFSCRIVWQINSESTNTLLQGLTYVAEKLGVEIPNNKDVIKNLMLKLSAFKDFMLVVFDNCVNQEHVDQYCIENPRIKYLATSRSNEWDTVLPIKKLSPDASFAYLQSLIRNFKEKEEMIILVEKLEHWPLTIQQSAAIIISKKITVKQFMGSIEADLNKQCPQEILFARLWYKIQRLLYEQVFVKLEKTTLSILQLFNINKTYKLIQLNLLFY